MGKKIKFLLFSVMICAVVFAVSCSESDEDIFMETVSGKTAILGNSMGIAIFADDAQSCLYTEYTTIANTSVYTTLALKSIESSTIGTYSATGASALKFKIQGKTGGYCTIGTGSSAETVSFEWDTN